MAFGRNRPAYGSGARRGGNKEFTSVRMTGLFETKKEGLLVGSVDLGENMDALIAKIKEAIAAGQGLAIFFKEYPEAQQGQPVAALFADVNKPRDKQAKPGRRAIQPDPETEEDDDFINKTGSETYDPFK